MKGDVSIAIVAPVQPEDFFDQLWQGVWEATFDLASFGVQVQNLTTDRYDVPGQRQILQHLLEEGIDSIAILPAHVSALNDLIDRHQSAGTPVVTFHGDAPESSRSAFVGPDPYQAGILAGEVLSKLMGSCGRVISFPGDPQKYHLARRYEGFRAELGKNYQMSEEPSTFEQVAWADGIYAGNEDLVEVARRLEEAGLRLPCVGFGNTPSVRSLFARSLISAVIDESRYQEGYFAVQKAYQAVLAKLSGAALDGVRIPSTVVFATNAADTGDSLHSAFELVVKQRTEVLFRYKKRLEQANAELVGLSVTDPLTGLLNRRKFEEVMASEVNRAKRYGAMSLLMIDLNGFKLINDRLGHQAGDEVLKTVARVLKHCCRSTDTCARLGGDEFAVVLPHTDGQAASVVRDRIQDEMSRSYVSLSIGAATLPEDGSDSEHLIAVADADMYRRKQVVGRAILPAAGF